MNFIFIADVFADEIPGGGELVNDLVCQGLENRGHHVRKVRSENLTPVDLENAIMNGQCVILANHLLVSDRCKQMLRDLSMNSNKFRFIIYEHDHKYIEGRDPSKYENFTAPDPTHINGPGLYATAKVLCQSKIHKDVLQRNISVADAVNLECSIWSDNFIEAAENLKIVKTKSAAILKSTNPTKNQIAAEMYCRSNNIEYDLVAADNPVELLKVLSQYEKFVFFPAVLETFCRTIVEAKLAGCKIITNPKLLGVASEEWFTSGTREDIINKMKGSLDNTLDIIENTFKEASLRHETPEALGSDITVILNSYRRPYNLEKQIKAIREQSAPPKEIWLWINDHEDNRDFDHTKLDVDRIFHNNHNWKFYGRFAAALLADTEFIAIFDDDTIPGSDWFSCCYKSFAHRQAILGSAGVVLNSSESYADHDRVGWPSQNKDMERVDLVGHAWFFKRDWLQYLWREKPYTWDNGEDIQFSYLAQKYGGIETYVPPHPPGMPHLHGSILGNELGIDDKATSTNSAVSHEQFFSERDRCVKNAIQGGWATVRNLK
jgi:hypothetical protein